MRLIILYGPPAVGKYTVGRALSRQTGYPLFHNHVVVDALMPFFPFGTPAFARAARKFRLVVLREALRAKLPGIILTFVWWMKDPGDQAFVRSITTPMRRAGGSIHFVELRCERSVLLSRVTHASRKKFRKLLSRSKLKRLLSRHQMNSDRAVERPRGTLVLDTDRVRPAEAAQMIARRFRLPVRK